MTNPDAEREAAWQAWAATPDGDKACSTWCGDGYHEYEMDISHYVEKGFLAGYEAARASAAPAPDAGERETMRERAEHVIQPIPNNENIRMYRYSEVYDLARDVLALLDAAAIAAQAE